MTMIFCPVKKERGGEGENGAVDADADGIKAERQYDAIHAETKEEEAARKKTDEPIPDVIDDELEAEQEEVVVVKPALEVETKAAPVEEINVAAPLTQAEGRPTTPVKAANGLLINGSDYATSNGVAEEEDEDLGPLIVSTDGWFSRFSIFSLRTQTDADFPNRGNRGVHFEVQTEGSLYQY